MIEGTNSNKGDKLAQELDKKMAEVLREETNFGKNKSNKRGQTSAQGKNFSTH